MSASPMESPVLAALTARRSANSRQLALPAPPASEIEQIVTAAAAAPDHGLLVPFRFIEILPAARERLADAFIACLSRRGEAADEAALAKARNKATLGPLNLGVVARVRKAHPKIIESDQWLTVGGALQNMVLAAEALGYAVAIRSGADFASQEASRALGLAAGEELVAIVAIGTAPEKLPPRPKPALTDVFARVS